MIGPGILHVSMRRCWRLPLWVRRSPVATTAQVRKGNVASLGSGERWHSKTAAGLGPRSALRKFELGQLSLDDRLAWVEKARLQAILGSCRLSIESLKSGVRCYVGFVGEPH